MKNNFRITVIVVIVTIIGFSIIACENGPGTGNGNIPPVFSGSFNKSDINLSGSNITFFNINIPEDIQNRAMEEVADHEISGVIKDGNKTIQITGTYNPVTGSYNLSAAAEIDGKDVRYVITGAIDPDDPRYFNANGIKIHMLVKDIDWNVYAYPVSEATEVISGTPVSSEAGIPQEFLGNWLTEIIPIENGSYYFNLIVSPYYMMVETTYEYDNGNIIGIPTMECILVSCTPGVPTGLYELIIIQPVYMVGDAFPASKLTVDDVNNAFLDYLTSIGIEESDLERCENQGDVNINDGLIRYFIQDNTQAGDITANNFLTDDQLLEFRDSYLPQYCLVNGFHPLPAYSRFDAQMDGEIFLLTQYNYEDGDDATIAVFSLQDLDDLTEKQEPFVCMRF